ncbi:helix-turn-helix domain-containing protein [bacterium SGD-2]|nr:helix-turn-helix domain-containing protein [bacterium SGD-2]
MKVLPRLVLVLEAPAFQAPRAIVLALLSHGCVVRVYRDSAEFERALIAAAARHQRHIALLAGRTEFVVRAATRVANLGTGVVLAALVAPLTGAGLQRVLQVGIGVCWPPTAPPAQVAQILSGLTGGGDTSGVAPEVPNAQNGQRAAVSPGNESCWQLASQGWVVQALGGARVTLTNIERSLVLALLAAPGQRLAHAALMAAVAADRPSAAAGSPARAARRLSVLMSRLRRKFVAAGCEPPVQSVRGQGYALCVSFGSQAVAVAPATVSAAAEP